MSKSTIEKLNEDIPRHVISEREGARGRKLSYLEGWYVINRLNEVLGQGAWSYTIQSLQKVRETEIENKQGYKGVGVAYLATVNLDAVIEGRPVRFSDTGSGKGQDYSQGGLEADESASKEAVTDALKRCAKNLGMSMGLALYDKTQANVSDEEEIKVEVPKPKVQTQSKQEVSNTAVKPVTSNKSNNEAKVGAIKAAAKVLNSQGKLTIENFKSTYLTPANAAKVDELSPTGLAIVYTEIKTKYPELGLA